LWSRKKSLKYTLFPVYLKNCPKAPTTGCLDIYPVAYLLSGSRSISMEFRPYRRLFGTFGVFEITTVVWDRLAGNLGVPHTTVHVSLFLFFNNIVTIGDHRALFVASGTLCRPASLRQRHSASSSVA